MIQLIGRPKPVSPPMGKNNTFVLNIQQWYTALGTRIFFANKCSFKIFIYFSAIEDWNTSQITDMTSVFLSQSNCNPDISGWDVSKVTNFVSNNSIFWKNNCYFLLYIKLIILSVCLLISSVYSQMEMFAGATSFNSDISKWDVSSGIYFVSGLDY